VRRLLFILSFLTITHFAFADTHVVMPITFYNYVQPGIVSVGNPSVFGPSIDTNGGVAQWSIQVNGKQPVGLLIGTVFEPCYTTGGLVMLNQAIYKHDTISIIYGQPQIPTGITCGCYGSACDVG
jgi:hypothetical protein